MPLEEDDDKDEAGGKGTLDEGGIRARMVAFVKRTRDRLVLLVKMSFGWWTKEVCDQLQLSTWAGRFDPDEADDDDNIRATVRAIGKTNTIIWQLAPPLVVVAKFAEVGSGLVFWREWSAGRVWSADRRAAAAQT